MAASWAAPVYEKSKMVDVYFVTVMRWRRWGTLHWVRVRGACIWRPLQTTDTRRFAANSNSTKPVVSSPDSTPLHHHHHHHHHHPCLHRCLLRPLNPHPPHHLLRQHPNAPVQAALPAALPAAGEGPQVARCHAQCCPHYRLRPHQQHERQLGGSRAPQLPSAGGLASCCWHPPHLPAMHHPSPRWRCQTCHALTCAPSHPHPHPHPRHRRRLHQPLAWAFERSHDSVSRRAAMQPADRQAWQRYSFSWQFSLSAIDLAPRKLA